MMYLLPILSVFWGLAIAVIISIKASNLKLLLTFSGAFLLSVLCFELLPDVFGALGKKAGIWIFLGIVLQIVLEFFSKGAEHGHVHAATEKMFPLGVVISLCIHSFFEGIPLAQNHALIFGVSLHKLPVAMVLSAFLIQHRFKTINLLLILVLFAAATPLGVFVGRYWSAETAILLPLNALVAGILLHVSTTLILESNEKH
ncbi:MAG: ZIP family metal transporter, partial [Flavobacteriaceae bacterium]|nr:ZIP family metal transporter [Flavobacteriaceae bacterium]